MAYKDHEKVAMFLVYVREAHPVRRSRVTKTGKPESPRDIAQPRTIEERVLAASACMKGLKLTLPTLIDTMDGVVGKAYKGTPAATAIVDLDDKLVFHSRGPRGVRPDRAEKSLRELVGDPPTEKEKAKDAKPPSSTEDK